MRLVSEDKGILHFDIGSHLSTILRVEKMIKEDEGQIL
ncbi:hypothetical protein V6Z11_D11G300300 [Gossypium hirsutum]